MKFLAFTDIHEDTKMLDELVARAREEDIDFPVCCGDISVFGRGLRPVLKKLNSLGKKIYLIPGNHESGGMLDNVSEAFPNCVSLHKKAVPVGDYIFLGYGEGGFALEDPAFRKIAREWYGSFKEKKIVLVTHQPPFGTTLDKLGERHVGNKDFRKFIERIAPKLVISGHLHETVGALDSIGVTKLVNPGWEGRVISLK